MRILIRVLPLFVVAAALIGCGSGDSEDVISGKEVVLNVKGMT